MKTIKPFIRLYCFFFLTCSLISIFPAIALCDKPKIEIKMAALAPEGTSWADAAHAYSREIEKRTDGRINVVWYLGGVMGDESDMIRKIRFGQLHGGAFTLSGLGLIDPAIRILEVPGLFRNYDEVDYVLEEMKEDLGKIFLKKNFNYFGRGEVGFIHIYSQKKISGYKDIRDLKIWLWTGDPVISEFFKVMDAGSGVPLSMPEVFPSLQTGLIDSFIGTHYTTVSLQWGGYAKYVLKHNAAYTPSFALLYEPFLKKLSAGDRKIILDTAYDVFPDMIPRVREDNRKAFETLKKHGVEAVEQTEEDRIFAEKAFQKIHDNLKGKLFSEALYDRIQSKLSEYRSKKGNQ